MKGIKPKVIVKQCVPGWRAPDRARLLTAKGWVKVDPAIVVQLLQNASHAAVEPAKRLLWTMQRQPWFLHAQTDVQSVGHTGVVVNVAGQSWHLHCEGGAHLRRIEATV